MVIGHSGCPNYLHRFIYLFHMPCFFFISGWLLKDKYLTNIKNGLYNKIKGSYIPFVKWSLIFLLFHNVFVRFHIYDADTYYSLTDFNVKVLRIITMSGGEQLLGGYWFLISLFWASVISILFFYFLKKIGKLNQGYMLKGILTVIIIATIEKLLPLKLPAQFGEQTLLATAFYMSGYYFHLFNIDIKRIWQVLFILIPAIAAIFIGLSMHNTGINALLYYAIALVGSIGIMSSASWLAKYKINKILAYIGNKTLYILTFHFLAFKLVSLFYIHYKGLSIDLLAQFPVLKDPNPYIWFIYSVAGVSLPLLIWEVLHRLPALLVKSD